MKTSIVYAMVKCVVRHGDDQDPEEVMEEADYSFELDGQCPKILIKHRG